VQYRKVLTPPFHIISNTFGNFDVRQNNYFVKKKKVKVVPFNEAP